MVLLAKSLSYPEAFFYTSVGIISFTCIREASKDYSFWLTIDCAVSLSNNVPEESLVMIINSQSLVMIINSLMEAFYIFTLKCSYLCPTMEKFLLLNSCRNKMTEQIIGRNKGDLRLAWK